MSFSQIETLDFSGKTKLHRKWESTLLHRRFKKGEEEELQLIEAFKKARVSQMDLQTMGYTDFCTTKVKIPFQNYKQLLIFINPQKNKKSDICRQL